MDKSAGIAGQLHVKQEEPGGHPGGGSKGGSRRSWNRPKKRAPEVVPPAWCEALADHWAKLDEIELAWRMGSGSDLEIWKLLSLPEAITIEAKEVTRAQLRGPELIDAANELGQELWDMVFAYTDERGPVMNWTLAGYAYKGKKKERTRLFAIARECVTDGSSGGRSSVGLVEGGILPTVDSILRHVTGQAKDVHGYNIKLLGAVAEPLASVGKLADSWIGRHRELQEFESYLMGEAYRGELIKAETEASKFRWERIEKMWTTSVDSIGAQVVNLGVQFLDSRYGISEHGPLPKTIPDACRELVRTMTLFAWDELADDFRKDFGSLLSSCADKTEDEPATVAAWVAYESDVAKHLPTWLVHLTARQRMLLHIIRNRLNELTNADEAARAARDWFT